MIFLVKFRNYEEKYFKKILCHNSLLKKKDLSLFEKINSPHSMQHEKMLKVLYLDI